MGGPAQRHSSGLAGCVGVSLGPKVEVLDWPKEKPVLVAVEPNKPAAVLGGAAAAAPNSPPAPPAIGVVGPFLPAW